jgi:hypothetical protein
MPVQRHRQHHCQRQQEFAMTGMTGSVGSVGADGSTTLVDPRGLRFTAGVTTVVLALVLVTGSAVLLGVQGLVFAIGAFAGLRRAPYGWFFRRTLAGRLRPPAALEAETPPRFAQGLGLAFAVVGVIGYASGNGWLGLTATSLAWVAAFLNAAFGYCLGCETYLLIRRLSTRKGVTA